MVLSKIHKLYLGVLVLIIFVTISLAYLSSYQEMISPVKQIQLKINNNLIQVAISDTPERQYLGLSNRESLCADCGMLFIFPDKKIRKFVMRSMNFPLDIIFISDNKIINIEENLSPEGESPVNIYSSATPVDMVLELNGLYSKINNLKVGDEIIIENRN